MLAKLADALRLSEDDRDHLRKLASINSNVELCPEIGPPPRTVRPAVQEVLDRLEPAPAFVLNNLSDLLAWTSTYAKLAEPLGILDDSPPNLLRYTFTDARSRDAYPGWDAVVDEQVANLVAHTSCGDSVRHRAQRRRTWPQTTRRPAPSTCSPAATPAPSARSGRRPRSKP